MTAPTSAIPTLDELGSSPLVHRPSDVFNPPALTNFLGGAQAAVDPVAIWNLNFPPFACGELITGSLFLDGWVFPASGEPVTFRWFPDRVERRVAWRGLEVSSTTVLAWRAMAALVRVSVRNVAGERRPVRVGFGIQGSIARSDAPWHRAEAPSEDPGRVAVDGWLTPVGPITGEHRVVDPARRAITFTSPSGAACVQGVVAPDGRLDERGAWFEPELTPGETWEGTFIVAVGEDVAAAAALFDRLSADVAGAFELVHREWAAELEAIFTPGNDRWSGSLPVLETSDPDLRRLYAIGALGVAYFKRESPYSAVGRAYDTLMPRYWATTTFIWDYSLSSLVHALLDPAEMRGQLERWMALDVHRCYGSDWLTGEPVGMWYAVNDHAMTQSIDTYLRWTGDRAWLDAAVRAGDGSPSTVRRQLEGYATGWRAFASPRGLADYGGAGNLLECVSSYIHEVAALNAANVWNLRTAAQYASPGDARALRSEAASLAERLWALYAEGEGWFNARQPDGALLPVRHCYDLLMVLGLIPEEISATRREEMVRFFETQLRTPTWMRALSPADPDAITSVRPDHQWNGAYPAWPAYVAAGLFAIGRDDVASDWLRGLAKTANQGPFGQAHFVEAFLAADAGGATKASSDQPYINDWACSSGGAWTRLTIESVFGVRAGADGITATPRLDRLDPHARLVDLPWHGRLFTVDRRGVHEP